MQKITKLSLIVVLPLIVVVAIAASVLTGTDHTDPDRPEMQALLESVPADTPFFFAGQYDRDSIDYSDALMRRSNPQDLEHIVELIEGLSDRPEASLLGWLLDDYSHTVATTGMTGLAERYGTDLYGTYAVYFHGAAPVVRWQLENSDAIRSVLAEAQADTGSEPREEPLGESSLQVWPLFDDQEVELALLLEDNWLTLSLIHPSDSDTARLQRFAQTPSADPLAGTAKLAQLREGYADAEAFMGFLDIHQILQAVLLPEQNSTGRELLQWFPEFADTLQEGQSPECRRDMVSLAAQAPRLSFGLQDMNLQDDALRQHLGLDLRIENTTTLTALRNMQGFVPDYTRRHDDKRLAFALGLDMSQLVPVATELWTQFTNARFECQELIEMQQMAQGFNPAMLAMMGAAMVDSVRGAGFAVYDINEQATGPQELLGAMLVSLSSEDPSAIAALLGMYLPQMAGVSIPDDGTPVAVPEVMGMTGLQAAIQGKHLVLFRGEAAERDAEALGDEPLSKNGLTGLAVNLRDLAPLLSLAEDALGGGPGGQCSDLVGGVLGLAKFDMAFTWSETLNDDGWAADWDLLAGILPTLEAGDLSGEYQLMALDDYDCRWYPIGSETLNPDGSGEFSGFNEEQDCENYRSEFEWQLIGSLLRQAPVSQRERFDCSAEWNEVESLEPFSCEVMQESEDGFYCLSTTEGEMDVYRYIAQ